jgi:fimbrial isopeptide formation D2 family protein
MRRHRQIVAMVAVVVVLLSVMLPAAMAQEPPTFIPPEIYKDVDDPVVAVGDRVTFTIAIVNPGDPATDATWYNLVVTDVVDPALRIDGASSTRGTVTITGQVVRVNGGMTLAPGEEFVITIRCTLVGEVTPGQVLINTATLEYTDDEDNPQPPIDVDEPVEIIIEETPVIPEASTLILLGSAATGLAGYASLQIRARRRRGG